MGFFTKIKWSNSGEWISSFWVNVAATVFGIVLTFGVTEWLEKREERLAAEELVERSFKNMEVRLDDLSHAIYTLDIQDSLLIICSNGLPTLDSVSSEDLGGLVSCMFTRWSLFENKSVETGFQQDIHSQKILGPFADILAEAFETMNYAEGLNEQINEYKTEFIRMAANYQTPSAQMTLSRQDCIALLSRPESVFFLSEISTLTNSLHRAHRFLSYYLSEAKALWNEEITLEEYEKRAKPYGTL